MLFASLKNMPSNTELNIFLQSYFIIQNVYQEISSDAQSQFSFTNLHHASNYIAACFMVMHIPVYLILKYLQIIPLSTVQ